MEISSPQQIVDLLANLKLDDKQKQKLNRDLANMARRHFRAQISAQKDIHGKSYAPRKRRQAIMTASGKVKINKNMLMGLSRMLQTQADADGFRVGLSGMAGVVGQIHNEGQSVTFPRRINGWFDSKANTWTGGTKRKGLYRMPKRPFIGWDKDLIKKIEMEIIKHMELKQ